jgi:integrase
MKRGLLTREAVLTATKNMPDGHGLTLKVRGDRKVWVYRYSWLGEQVTMQLGDVETDGLSDPNKARDLRDAARLKVRDGINPKGEKPGRVGHTMKTTFGEFATRERERLGPPKEPGNSVWLRHMTEHVGDLADLPPANIGVEDVADALRPYWIDRNPTAQKLRAAIEAVWFAAQADSLIPIEATNPALKKGPLLHKLKKLPRRKVKHFDSLPYPELADFLARLRSKQQPSYLALEWIILSACRPGEACKATWGEIDLKRRLWVIPPLHLKSEDDTEGHPHCVPLTRAMLNVLRAARPLHRKPRPGDFIFPNPRGRKRGCYVPNSLWQALQHFKLGEATPHGFRSTFADWAKEAGYSKEWVDLALGHAVGNATTSAYQRSRLVELRRPMMQAWSAFCAQPPKRAAEPLRIAA